MADIVRFEDQLRVEGINFKGFGILPKYVMIDRDLSLDAKTIYAYFCSFAGNGNTTFPGRDKILENLPMSKDSYYKHFHYLVEQGYISVLQNRQEGNRFSQNVYTLVSNPKKFLDNPVDDSESRLYSRIRFSGLKSMGFGIIPKAVMIDERLPVKAKGIYAYFCSFTGSGDSAFPQKEQILFHLKISDNTYYKFYKYLTDLNYITVVQRRGESGRMGINDYYLNDNPDASTVSKDIVIVDFSPHLKISDTGNVEDSSPYLNNSDTAPHLNLPDTEIPDTEKQDTNINSININNLEYKQSLNQSIDNLNTRVENRSEGESDSIFLNKIIERILTEKRIPVDYLDDVNVMTNVVHFLTDWETLHPNGYFNVLKQKAYDLFNQALIEMCCFSKQMTFKGTNVLRETIIEKLNELCNFKDQYVDISDLIDAAIETYITKVTTQEVHNPRQYMKACIWDILATGNIGFYQRMSCVAD